MILFLLMIYCPLTLTMADFHFLISLGTEHPFYLLMVFHHQSIAKIHLLVRHTWPHLFIVF